MDRPGARPSADEHWAPDHLVLDKRVLTYSGRILAEREPDGQILLSSPLAGMAAVEQRYPAWALGPFGRLEPERELPPAPGVFALATQGTVQYVGASADLARTFDDRHGLGHISRRDCQLSRREERCRLNRLITAQLQAGGVVDLYVMTTGSPSRLSAIVGRPLADAPTSHAAELARVANGSWHLPA